MKRKLLFLVIAVIFSGNAFSQKVISTSQSELKQQELVKKTPPEEGIIKEGLTEEQLHGPTTIVPFAAPGNTRAVGDDCTDPIIVSIPAASPYSDLSQTNCGRGNTYPDVTCLGYYDSGEDIIYRLDVTATGTVTITMDPKTTTYSGIAIADDCPDVGTCLDFATGSAASLRTISDVAVTAGNSYYIIVDTWASPNCIPDFDLTITYALPPTCPDPTAQTEANITATSVDLAWTSGGSAAWNIEYGPTGFTQGSGTVVAVTANPYTLMGLNSGTTYDWHVQDDCGGGDVSTWIGPSTFSTLQVAAPVQTIPFNENWEAGVIGTAWNYSAGSVSTIEVNTASARSGGTYGLEQYGNSSSSYSTPTDLPDAYTKALSGGSNENWTTWNQFSVDLTSASSPWLIFYYAMGYLYNDNYNNFWAQVSTDGSTWIDVFATQTNGAATPYTKQEINLSAYNGTAQLYIRFFHNGKYNTNYLWLDDIDVMEVSCAAPTALVHSNETAYGADLGWTSVDSFFDIYIVGSGAPAPTLTTTPTEDDFNGTAYTWTGGAPTRTYDWYVRTDCGQDNSNVSVWSGPETFTTLATCPAPSAQTLISVTPTSAEVGWTENGGATAWNIEYGADGFTQGSGTIVAATTNPWTITGLTDATDYDWYVQADCGGGDESTWIGPSGFTTPCNTISTFPYTEDFENAGDIPTCWTNDPGDAGGEWEFVTTDGNGPTADHTTGTGYYALLDDYGTQTVNSPFNLLTPRYDFSAPGMTYQIRYWAWIGPDGATNPIHIDVSDDGGATWTDDVFVHDHSTTSTWFENAVVLTGYSTSDVMVRFRGVSIWGYSTCNSGIDDVTVEEAPACVPPSALMATNVSGSQADLGWTENGTVTTWNIEWGLQGFTQGSGTLITGTTTNPHTLTNLAETTAYDWYVQSDCGGDQSTWTGPHTFTTTVACPPPTNLSATVTTTTADLAWTAVGLEPSWNIEWGLTGFTQGSGTLISNTTTNPHELTNLLENTAYDWYIQADCDPLPPSRDESTWAGPHTFNTACPASTVPYYENFDAVTAPAFPSCMLVENTNGDAYTWETNTTSLSPPNSARIRYNSSLAMDDWFFTQGLQLTAGITYAVSFAYATGSSTSFPENLAVDWGTSPSSTAMSGTPIFDQTGIMGGWYGGNGTFTPATSGTFYVGFHGYSGADEFYLYVDDISILEVFAASAWTGTVDNDWNTPGNWNPGLPSSGTDVTIPAGLTNYPTVGSATTIGSLLVESGSGGDASIVNDGLLIVSGTATVQRYLSGGMWHDVSASGQGQTVNSIYFNGSPDVWLKEYLEPTNTRRNITDINEPMSPGKGFEIWVADGNNVVAEFTGLLQRFDVALTTVSTPALSFSGLDPLGYNLIGNPFASPLDLDSTTWTTTDISSSFWVWDPASETYKDWNTTTKPGSGSLLNGIVPMGQGFFCQATGAAPAITIPAAARVHSTQAFYKNVKANRHTKMTLKAKLEVGHDEMNIIFHEKATNEFDVFDTRKMFAFSGNASQVYTVQSDEELSINSLPPLSNEGRSVKVGYVPGFDGKHAFEVNLEDLPDTEVFLEDLFTGDLISLVEQTEYEFEAYIGDEAERFILHFNPMTTGIGDSENESLISIYAFDDKLYIKSSGAAATEHKQIWVYDLMGRTAFRTTAEASTLTSIPTQYLNGYVIVRVMSESEVKTTKVYIK